MVETIFHKTSNYRAYTFLNVVDTVFVKAYEEIAANLMKKKHGADYEIPSNSPIFITGQGKQLVGTKKPLNVVTFCLRSGITTSHTAYMFRHMYATALYSARSNLLRDAERFSACHGQKTAVEKYLSPANKRMLAITGLVYFRTLIDKDSEVVTTSKGLVSCSEAQVERRRHALEHVTELMKTNALSVQKAKDDSVQPSLKRLIGERERVALVDMLYEADGVVNSRWCGSPMTLLTDINVVSNATYSLILRSFHSLPEDMPCVVALQQNLVSFCIKQDTSDGEIDMRDIEIEWADKLIMVLKNLRARPRGVANLCVLDAFFKIALATNGYMYCCGNTALQNQMVHWVTMDKVRKAKLDRTVEVVNYVTWYVTIIIEVEKLKASNASKTAKAVEQPAPGIVQTVEPPQAVDVVDDCEEEDELVLDLPARKEGYVFVEPSGRRTSTPARTPVKVIQGKVSAWTDDMKLQLLAEYCQYAHDPLARATTETGKGKIRTQLQSMIDLGTCGVYVDGEKASLGNWSADGMSQLFQMRGLSGQPKFKKGQNTRCGLVHIIDQFLDGKTASIELVRNSVEEIKDIARGYVL